MFKFTVFLLYICAVCAYQNIQPLGNVNGRIIGGTPANAAQFPFAASIHRQTTSGTYFCTGSLYKSQWIITAAQCVEDAILLTIRLGSNSLSENDPNAIRLATDSFILHPDYDPSTLENDIGLIELRMPITFTDYIKPITAVVSTNIPAGTMAVTLGWGQTSDSVAGTVDHLNYVYVVALTNLECSQTYVGQITDSMVCVEGNFNEGTCRGDLGSPLIQYGGSSVTYLVGVASFISTNGCESTDPSGFTRIAPYVDWIRNSTAA